MKVFDKAAWQIDNGVSEEKTIAHFQFIFTWLKEHGMLNRDGLEILDIGIDREVSLHDRLLTEEGQNFLNQVYDSMISMCAYDIALEERVLNEVYNAL